MQGVFLCPYMALTYTNIQHGFRKTNNLSCNEYILCDMIFYLSKSDSSTVPGWCYMSRENIAKEIGLSKQTVLNIIDRLIDKGFLIRNDQSKYLKTTTSWQQVYFTNGKESLPGPLEIGKETVPDAGKETLPYNNTLDNNSKEDNKDTPPPVDKLKIKKEKFYKDLRAYQKDNIDKYPVGLYKKFIAYWTEEHKNGKKIRLDDQDYFNIGKRLATFWQLTADDEKNNLWKEHNEAKAKQQPTLNF